MEINEDRIKSEVNSFIAGLQRLLPKRDDFRNIIIEVQKEKITRLSDVHSEAKSVFPRCFIGTKLVLLKAIMDRVQVTQQYNFGKPKESFKCFTQMLHKELEPKKANDGLVVDMSGAAVATYRERIDDMYEIRLTSKIRDLITSETEIEFEKESEKSIGSICLSMREVDPNTLQVVTQWMYKILPELFLGTEVSLRPLQPNSPSFSVSARYEKPSFTISSTVNKTGFQVCFFKKFAEHLSLATIINDGSRSGSTVFGLALNKNYQNGAQLKVFVDSERSGGFTVQKEVLFRESPQDVHVLRMIGSTLIDRQRRVKFGFGFHLEF